MSLTIRFAVESDIEAMTALHEASFTEEEHLGALLGRNFLRASYAWHVRNNRAYVLVAELDGNLVGLLGMCDGPFTRAMMWGCRYALAFSILQRPQRLLNRRMWARLGRASEVPVWVKEFFSAPSVAQMTIGVVNARARGQNVFPALIRKCEEISRERGVAAVRAGLYRKNESCRRAFIKAGWGEYPEMGAVDTVYFVRVLSPKLLERFSPLRSGSGMGVE